jgi:putative tricarboxylic transport membrane protein
VGDLPDTPTSAELGHPAKVTTTRGYAVHKDTPPEQVEQVEQLILQAMESERFHDYLRNSGLDPETNIAGMEVWDAQLKDEYETSVGAMRKLDLID